MVRDDTGAIGPYAYKGDQWVSFDDVDMIRKKSQYVKDMGIGGAMIWALDLVSKLISSIGVHRQKVLMLALF